MFKDDRITSAHTQNDKLVSLKLDLERVFPNGLERREKKTNNKTKTQATKAYKTLPVPPEERRVSHAYLGLQYKQKVTEKRGVKVLHYFFFLKYKFNLL